LKKKRNIMTKSVIKVIFFLCLFLNYSAHASTINVNTTSNAVANDGQCSLHEAILTSNSNTNSGNQPLECQGSGINGTVDEIYLVTGIYSPIVALPIITEAVSIHGQSSNSTIVNGSFGTQLFQINIPMLETEPTVAFYDLTVANATNDAALTITNSYSVYLIRTRFRLNQSGAVKSLDGFLNTINSSFSNNNNSENGGAILVESGTAYIKSSTFSFNESGGSGGALAVSGSTSASFIYSSTFSGNMADGNGGAFALLLAASTFIYDSTLTNNTTDADGDNFGDGAAIYLDDAFYLDATTDAAFENSVLANNIDSSPIFGNQLGDIARYDENSIVTSRGYNFIGNNNDAGPAFPLSPDINTPNANDDIVGFGLAPFDPKLDVLQDNGGPTLSHLPIFNGQIISPLIDAGQCVDIQPNGSAEQRDLVNIDYHFPTSIYYPPLARIYDEPSVVNLHSSGCDIGAVELKKSDIDDGLCFPVPLNAGGVTVICL
jgi:hypothetical protein